MGSTTRTTTNDDKSEGHRRHHHRPKPEDIPDGTFLLPWIWNMDPMSPLLKALILGTLMTGLLILWNLRSILNPLFPNFVMNHWDERHDIIIYNNTNNNSNSNSNSNMVSTMYDVFWLGGGGDDDDGSFRKLLAVALNLPKIWIQHCLNVTIALVVLYIMADIVLAGSNKKKSTTDDDPPYPISWKTNNTLCYHDMFCEPTRFGRLIRRPGNTLSNATYLLASLCVLSSCYYNYCITVSVSSVSKTTTTTTTTTTIFMFWADLLYGIMLLALAITSCWWHGSNGPWTQYVDLWSMNCCIPYLIIRNVLGIGLTVCLVRYTTMEPEKAQYIVSTLCAILYGGLIVQIGYTHYGWYTKGYLHGNCPFSGRARLLGISNLLSQGKPGHQDVHILDVAIFAALPIYSYGLIVILEIFLFQSFGSHYAGEITTRTLVFGWIYRFWDRWLLDGHPIINYLMKTLPPTSGLRTITMAILSPTAVLHFLTGITLLVGFAHSKSLEDDALSFL